MNRLDLNEISGEIVDASLKVHRALGPGLLESVYEACLAIELTQRGLKVESQVPFPVCYKGMQIGPGFRVDLLVEKEVIVELKVVSETTPIHRSQVLSYLRLSGKRLGLLVNFNVSRITDGITRIVNKL